MRLHVRERMPHWFPWIFVGGLIFIILSFIGAKYNNRLYNKISLLQDFISGSIMIAFIGVVYPDSFPEFPISLPDDTSFLKLDRLPTDDDLLDIGPPPLRR